MFELLAKAVPSFRVDVAYLFLNMVKVDTKLLEQRRLAIVAFCRKSSQPSRSQAAVFAHATRHAARTAKAACREARAGVVGAGEAVRSLLGGRSARDGVGRVRRRVELEVLCVASLVAVGGGALLAAVVVGHSVGGIYTVWIYVVVVQIRVSFLVTRNGKETQKTGCEGGGGDDVDNGSSLRDAPFRHKSFGRGHVGRKCGAGWTEGCLWQCTRRVAACKSSQSDVVVGVKPCLL